MTRFALEHKCGQLALGVDGFLINAFGPGAVQVVSVEELQTAVLADMVA